MDPFADFISLIRWLRAHGWAGLLLALLVPVLAYGVRLMMGPAIAGFPFITFFPAVALVAFATGWRWGLVSLALSALLANYYLMEPYGAFTLGNALGFNALIFFIASSALVVVLFASIGHSTIELAQTTESLRLLNEQLESRVAERTGDLAAANAVLQAEIEARQAAEAQVRQAQKMEAIGQLTGGIAHDFNNMLAIVVGSLEMARRRLTIAPPDGRDTRTDAVRYIGHAIEGASRAASLTARLLAFARRQPLAPGSVDTNSLVQGMAELLRRSLGASIALECVLAGGLWRTRIDQNQLENSVLNLALNARDAMPGGGRLTIETGNAHLDDAYARQQGDIEPGQYVMVAVSDTGEGMPADVIARAFDPFYTTKPVGQGTGLGLSQVYGFVKQSGGHVRIYSEMGRGTTVKLYLPRERTSAAAAQVPIPVTGSLGARGEPAVPGLSGDPMIDAAPTGRVEEIVLVVEDEDDVRRTAVDSLRELGYSVRHAASAAAALTVLDEQPGIGVMLTDIVMPRLNGRELADQVAARWPAVRIVFMTGYSPNAVVHNGVIDPGVHLLTKPFSIEQLARKVRTVLDQR